MKLLGIKPFRAMLEEKILLARYFYNQMESLPGIELGPFPDLSVVTFRYVPKSGGTNEFNKKIVEEIHKDGKVFLSSTMLNGKFTLRLAVLSFRTHLDTIDEAINILKRAIKNVECH